MKHSTKAIYKFLIISASEVFQISVEDQIVAALRLEPDASAQMSQLNSIILLGEDDRKSFQQIETFSEE